MSCIYSRYCYGIYAVFRIVLSRGWCQRRGFFFYQEPNTRSNGREMPCVIRPRRTKLHPCSRNHLYPIVELYRQSRLENEGHRISATQAQEKAKAAEWTSGSTSQQVLTPRKPLSHEPVRSTFQRRGSPVPCPTNAVSPLRRRTAAKENAPSRWGEDAPREAKGKREGPAERRDPRAGVTPWRVRASGRQGVRASA